MSAALTMFTECRRETAVRSCGCGLWLFVVVWTPEVRRRGLRLHVFAAVACTWLERAIVTLAGYAAVLTSCKH